MSSMSDTAKELQAMQDWASEPEGFTPEHPFVPPSARVRKVPVRRAGAQHLLDAVPEFTWAIKSPRVQEAATALVDAVRAANRAAASFLRVDSDAAAEEAAIIAAALQTGDSTATVTRTEWASEAALRQVRYSELHAAATKAARELKEVRTAEAPAALADLVSDAAKARKTASAAIDKAQLAVAEAVGAAKLIRELDRAENIVPANWFQSANQGLEASASAGIAAARRWVDTAEHDPVLSGSYVLDPVTDQVPACTIEALRASDRMSCWQALLAIQVNQDPADHAVRKNPSMSAGLASSGREAIAKRHLPRA